MSEIATEENISCRRKFTEQQRRNIKLSQTDIDQLCGYRCPAGANSCLFRNCMSKFGAISDFRECMINFRKQLWDVQPSDLCRDQTGTKARKCRLISLLLQLISTSNGVRSLNFRINQVQVCKSFFFEATGFERKLGLSIMSTIFPKADRHITGVASCLKAIASKTYRKNCGVITDDTILNAIKSHNLGRSSDRVESSNLAAPIRIDRVLSFLDSMFKTNVEVAPEGREVKYISKTWRKLYDVDYCKYCKDIGEIPLHYNTFVAIRRQHRYIL